MKQQSKMFVSTMIIIVVFFIVGQSAIGVAYGYGYGYGYGYNHKHHNHSGEDKDGDVKPTPTPALAPTPIVVPTPSLTSTPEAASMATQGTPVTAPLQKKDSSRKKIEHKKTLKVSKKQVKKGDVLVQSGKHFSKKAIIALYFSKSDGGYYAPVMVRTNNKGTFSVNYKVNKTAGTYKWYAVDTKSGGQTKTSVYTIVK